MATGKPDGDIEFDWDEEKRLSNFEKHGIDFEKVPDIFSAPDSFVLPSTNDAEEPRWVRLGTLDGSVIVVIYTIRDQTIRIISARPSSRKERALWQARTS